MDGIGSSLLTQLREVLLRCGSFDNDDELRAVFVDERISPWRHLLPTAASPTGRVNRVIEFLSTQSNDKGENALVLFLYVLSEGISQGNKCKGELARLAAGLSGLEEDPESSSIMPPAPSTGTSIEPQNPMIEKEEEAIKQQMSTPNMNIPIDSPTEPLIAPIEDQHPTTASSPPRNATTLPSNIALQYPDQPKRTKPLPVYIYRVNIIGFDTVRVEKSNGRSLIRTRNFQYKELKSVIQKLSERVYKERELDEATLKELGKVLFDALLEPSVQDEFRSFYREARERNALLRVELVVNESQISEVAALPWEFLHAPADEATNSISLGTNLNLAFIRHRESVEIVDNIKLQRGEKLRVVLAVANPSRLRPIQYEALKDQVDAFVRNGGHCEVIFATRSNLQRVLESEKPPHILHFIGHGKLKESVRIGSQIALLDESGEADWINADTFSQLFIHHPQPKIVLLQACELGATVPSQPFVGVASQVVQAGVPVVIAMRYEISNITAGRFVNEFYRRLLVRRESVEQAVQAGRLAIEDSHHPRDVASPVLYLQARDGHLFEDSLFEQFKKFCRERLGITLILNIMQVLALVAVLAVAIYRFGPDTRIKVAIASFVGCAEISDTLLATLDKEVDGVKFTRLGEIHEQSQARAQAAEGANLVIWGKCNQGDQKLALNFELLTSHAPSEVIDLREVSVQIAEADTNSIKEFSSALIMYVGGNYNLAAGPLGKLRRMGTSDESRLALLQGNSLLFAQKYGEAIDVYKTLEGTSVVAEALNNQGVAGINWARQIYNLNPANKEYEEKLLDARAVLEEVVQKHPELSVLAFSNLGASHYWIDSELSVDQDGYDNCHNAVLADGTQSLGYLCRAAARYFLLIEPCNIEGLQAGLEDLNLAEKYAGDLGQNSVLIAD